MARHIHSSTCHPYLSGHVARSCTFFWNGTSVSLSWFPSCDVFRLYGPRPVFTSERNDCIDVVHQSLTLHLPRNMFVFVYENILPESLVCWLHSFFNGIVRFPLTIHGTPQYLDLLFKGKLVASRWVAPNHLNQNVRVHHRLAGLGTKFHLFASSIMSRNICSNFSYFQGPRDYPFFSSPILLPPLARIWVAIFCHKRGASTLSCRKLLLKTKLFSTHSNMALPSSPDISRKRAAINHPCVSWCSKICATCFGFASSKAVLISKLARYTVGLTTLPCLKTGFLSSCHSQSFAVHSSPSLANARPTCYNFQTLFPFPQNNAGCIPLRHHRCQHKCTVASDPLLRGSVQFLRKTNFTIFQELGDSMWTMKRFWKHVGIVKLFPGATAWSSHSLLRLLVRWPCCRSVWPWLATPRQLWFLHCVRPL